MGKHDKQTKVDFKWDPPKDYFYKARINALERENEKLREELNKKEQCIGIYELAVDHQDEVSSGIIAEYKDLLDEKDDEIAVLQGKISMLEKAIVNGALREVLA